MPSYYGGLVMLVLIILGGVVCLLTAMLVSDVLIYKDFPVVDYNWIPMGLLIAFVASIMASMVMV